jgi:very-short-patch-repair endonuclease
MEDKLVNNKKFLEILRDKLSKGNNKSIHLNALPGRSATRIDFLEIDLIKRNFSRDFITKLLTKKSFKIEITFEDDFDINKLDEKVAKKLTVSIRRLKSICKQNNDYFQEHGIKPFGFGFPIVLKRDNKDPKNIIKAPLIIWALEIEEDRKQVNKWTIKREEDYPIYFNDVLISHIEKDEGIKISKIKKEFLDDFLLDINELSEVTSDFINQFGSKISLNAIQDILTDYHTCEVTSDEEELIFKIPKITGSGIFGLFINQKQTIIEDYNLFIEKDTNPDLASLVNENFKINPFTAIDTDPSQQSVLNNLALKNRIIIHGPPGTGKSQSLTAVIANALANQAKCLIVCEKRTALDVIYNNLKELGLEKIIALIEDTSKDRRKIIDKARDTIDDINKTSYKYFNYKFNESEFLKLVNDTKDVRDSILDYHKKIDHQLFNEDNWTDLVGRFLNSSKQINIKDFDKLITTDSFSYDYPEFKNLYNTIVKLQSYFERYNPKTSSLEFINYDSVKGIDLISVHDHLIDIIEKYSHNHKDILVRINSILSEYKSLLESDCNIHYKSIKEKIHLTKVLFDNNSGYFLFNKVHWINDFPLGISSLFSAKYKKVKDDKKSFLLLFEEIENEINFFNYISYKKLDLEDKKYLKNCDDRLNFLHNDLNAWHLDISNFIEGRINELGLGDTIKFVNLQNAINELNISYNTHLHNHLSAITFSFDYPNKILSISSLRAPIEFFEEKLLMIRKELDSIHDFLDWKGFYIQLNNKEKAITDAIIQIDLQNGDSYFRSWYYSKVLLKNSLKPLSGIDSLLDNISLNGESLKSQTIKKILTVWQTKRIESIYRYNNKSSFNAKQLFAKTNKSGRKQSLRNIIFEDFDLFTDLFPVVMVNPSVCSSIFPLKENLFDIVLFDEASQLRIEDTFCSLVRGKIRIISGDEHQMPPSSYFQSNEYFIDSEADDISENDDLQNSRRFDDAIVNLAYQESLLDYASELAYTDVDLQIHYRSRHPLLINFSNAAFYGKKLNPLPERNDYKPIKFIKVNGTYHNQVNEAEAKQVISILKNSIFKDESRKYPSIGIATFNIHQRNLIIDEINREANSDPDFSIKVDALYENGLFIKNLENIQGDERDIIIISTTFGYNKDGYFAERFGPLNMSLKGHRLLNVIITRAKYKIFVCSSFPDEKIATFKDHLQQYGNIGRGILYAYIAYAKAIETSDWDSVDYILSLLLDKSTLNFKSQEPLIGTESPFEDEVVDYLVGSGFSSNRIILQYKCGGFRIDIAILSKYRNKPIIAIECDGASYHSSNEAYLWDTFRQKQLENYGLKFVRIWSTNWWINPKKELSKILKFISDIDSQDSDAIWKKVTNKNLQDIIVTPIITSLKEVKLNSVVKILDNKTNKEFKIKLVDDPQLKVKHLDIQPVFFKAPLALALLGKSEGDNVQIELSGQIYKVTEILN